MNPPGTQDIIRPVVAVVDDDPVTRSTFIAMLEPEGYRIEPVASGNALLESLSLLNPDVVLLDVQMPGMDGFEVCMRIKENPHQHFIPIIMVTALEGQRPLVKGLGVGADEFLSKPIIRTELCARVRSMLRIKAQADQLRKQAQALETAREQREAFNTFFFHDMKNMLGALLSTMSLLRTLTPSDPALPEVLASTTATGESLARMVGNMLELSVRSGWAVEQSWHCVGEVMYRATSRAHGLARVAGVEVIAEGVGWIEADRQLLDRILDNLLDNAVRASPPGGKVWLKGQAGEILVQDEGPGLPVDVQAAIFGSALPDWHSLHGRGASVGVGLAFSRLAAAAFGGSLEPVAGASGACLAIRKSKAV
jgi:DNA-binding response OmpR family regulator